MNLIRRHQATLDISLMTNMRLLLSEREAREKQIQSQSMLLQPNEASPYVFAVAHLCKAAVHMQQQSGSSTPQPLRGNTHGYDQTRNGLKNSEPGRLQHPEVNSRRPGRLEVRPSPTERGLILYQIFLPGLVQVGFLYAPCKSSACVCFWFFSPHHSPPLLSVWAVFKACKSCNKMQRKRSNWDLFIFFSVVQMKESVRCSCTETRCIVAAATTALSTRMIAVGSVCFFSPPSRAGLFKPANQSKQSLVA